MPHDSYSIERKTLNLTEIEIDDDPLEHEMVEENEVDEVDEVDELDKHEMEDEPTETSPREYLLAQHLLMCSVGEDSFSRRMYSLLFKFRVSTFQIVSFKILKILQLR